MAYLAQEIIEELREKEQGDEDSND
jgi:hypothetical protein